MLTLIIGRTASGKDALAGLLEGLHLNGVVSRTTRPPRGQDDTSHIFVTEQQMHDDEPKIASTVIAGHTYYTLPDDLKDKHFYIIDPVGAAELIKNHPRVAFHIVYVYAGKDKRKSWFTMRQKAHDPSMDDEQIQTLWDMRQDAENAQFTEFENKISQLDPSDLANSFASNVISVSIVANQADSLEALAETAQRIRASHSMHNMIDATIPMAVETGCLFPTPTEDLPDDAVFYDFVRTWTAPDTPDAEYKHTDVPRDVFVNMVANTPQLLGNYLLQLSEKANGLLHISVLDVRELMEEAPAQD